MMTADAAKRGRARRKTDRKVRFFGDEKLWRTVCGVAPELPLFMLGGLISGYTGSLDRAMEAKEVAGKERTPRRRRRETAA